VLEIEENKYLDRSWMKIWQLTCQPETMEPYPEDVTYTVFHLDEPAKNGPILWL